MKTIKKKITYMTIIALVGASFIVAAVLSDKNASLMGVGVGMAAVALLKIVQYLRIMRDPEKIRKIEIAQTEERLVFLANKAAAMTFYGIMIAEYIAMLVCMFIGRESLATTLSFIVCAELLLYLVIHIVLNKKY